MFSLILFYSGPFIRITQLLLLAAKSWRTLVTAKIKNTEKM